MKDEAIRYTQPEGMRPALSIIAVNNKDKKPFAETHGWKDATKDREQIEKWWNDHPSANIAIATGEINDLLVIDVDIKHDQGKYGDESMKVLEQELGALPDTWTAITGSGGLHYYFRYPKGHEISISASNLAKDIDIRANGGYVVAPPSIHYDTGNPYEWDGGFDPVDTPLAELPEKWVERLENPLSENSQAVKFTLPENIAEGARNATLFRYGASLRAKAVPALKTLKLLHDGNNERCIPPLPDKEVEKIYESVMKYKAGSSVDEIMKAREQDFADTEEDLSQFHHFNAKGVPTSVYDVRIFEYLSQRNDIFILGSVPYMHKDGVYRCDMSGANLKTAISRLIYPELDRSTTEDRIFKLFLNREKLIVSYTELNQYPQHWINFQNGFYDPIAKKMIPHNLKYRAINQIPHEYDPEANLSGEEVEKWLEFIVPQPDEREMLLQYMGYCMTRDTRQQKFMILCGEGGSGKSVVIKMLENMIGYENISNVSLKELSQRFASYGLLGKLLNSCADLEVSALEDVSIIKKISGEDQIKFEAKGKDSFFGKSYAKMIFSTNELPLVKAEETNGFFRRLIVLNITRQPEKRIADFVDILRKETAYLIQISVKALERMYQKGIITESESSIEAVHRLRCDSDTVEAFLSERIERVPDSVINRIKKSELYSSYDAYCREFEYQPQRKKDFYRSMRAKGFGELKVSNGSECFRGIRYREKNSVNGFTEVDDKEIPFD